jgi:hypothetical protein
MGAMCGEDRTGGDCAVMHRTPRSPRRALLALAVTALAALTLGVLGTAVPAGAADASPAAPSVAAAGAEPGDTTTTLPRDNRQLGDIIPKPNSGADPTSPGDPGGWLQVSLFFLICGAILVMAGLVVFQSTRARRRREQAGLDPVSLAKATGKGVRAPSPLGTKDATRSDAS